MAVHGAARADHHVESARLTGESASARRVAAPRHRQAADLRAGDLRLRCIAAASGLRHVVGTVMLGSGLSRDRNHEYSEGKCDGFHNGLSWLHSPIERANRCLDPSGTSIQVIVPLVPGGTSQQDRRLPHMDATDDTKNLRKARAIVSEKLRAYFAEIKAGLDADSEDFFRRVMQQADQRQDAGLR